jgi:hypothetical protein
VCVRLNGVTVSDLQGGIPRAEGHLGLQAHHPGSRVRFRALQVSRL